MRKKIISILLTACMITSLLPLMENGVFAAGGLTRAEWITQLVAAFEMSVEDEDNMPDNYFSDISEDDSYYRDILLAVEFGVIDLEAGEAFEPSEPATREFAAQTLNACMKYQLDEGTEYTFSESETVTYPDDIQVAINRGWFTLSSGNFLPEQAITSAEAEAMLTDAKTTIAGDTVEENYNSQYEFADGVIVVPETADVTIEGEYTVTIANWEGTISENDIFVVYSYGIPVPLKAETVETGEEIIITATKEGTDDAIVSADSQGITDVDLEDFEANELTTYSLMSVDGNDSEELDIQLQSISYDSKTKMLTAKHDVKIQDGLAGSITVEIGNLKLNHKENTTVGSYEAFLTGNASVTKNFYFDFGDWVGVPNHITIGYVNIGGIGSISLDVDLSLSGGITEVEKGTITAGFSYGRHDGFRLVCGYKKTYYSFEADAKVQLGLTLSLNIDLVFVKGRAWLTIGTECSYNKKDFTYVDGQNPIKCETIKGHLYANAGAKISLTYIVDKTLWEYRYDIYTESNSPLRVCYHYEDGELVDHCARSKDGNEAYTKYTTKISSAYFNPSPNYAKSSYGGSGSTATPVVVWEYKVEDGNATITGYKGNASALAIPSTIDGYTVTKIGDSAFNKNQNIRVITLPNSIINIGEYAFSNCKNLSMINLSHSITHIGAYAFEDCTSLEKIEIPKSLTSTGYNTTWGGIFTDSNLKDVTFEEGTTKIVAGLFLKCANLTEINIPDTVTNIEEYAFYYCENLKNIKMSENIISIGKAAFCGAAFNNIDIPDNVTSIGEYTFGNCKNLSVVNLSHSITHIGAYAFEDCTSLEKI
ncbi:MAG: leucine-rich repeat protein, partial [Clostridia bacterium]|nr:leucine-rich repeat protein [Clostridia bacterium]